MINEYINTIERLKDFLMEHTTELYSDESKIDLLMRLIDIENFFKLEVLPRSHNNHLETL